MSLDEGKIEAQLISYIKKVVYNTATNYYKKKYRQGEYEFSVEDVQDVLLDVKSCEIFFPTIAIMGYSMIFEDEIIINSISKLKEREKIFLLEKFLLGKTDREIGETLGISRQGVTNLKHRIYKKIRSSLEGASK